MKSIITFILIAISLDTFAQSATTRNWIDTEEKYSDSIGNSYTITNSLPKGGGTYTDAAGNIYSYVVFWFRMNNESEAPLELRLKFPNEPITIFPSNESHIKIFLPHETMTPEKIALLDYGLSNLKGFLDSEFFEPSVLEKTVSSHEEYFFYLTVLIYEAQGTARSALVMKDHQLFYHISIAPDSALIPCGQISFKN